MTNVRTVLFLSVALMFGASNATAQESGSYTIIDNEEFPIQMSEEQFVELLSGDASKDLEWAALAVSPDGAFGSVTKYTSGIDAYKDALHQCQARTPMRTGCTAKAWFHDKNGSEPGRWRGFVKCNRASDSIVYDKLYLLGGDKMTDSHKVFEDILTKDEWKISECFPVVFLTPSEEHITDFGLRPRMFPDEYVMTKEEIIQVQTVMIEWGWSIGGRNALNFFTPNGVMDPKTILAIRATQKEKGWPLTGYFTEQQFREVVALGKPPDWTWFAFSYADDGSHSVVKGFSSGVEAYTKAQEECASKTTELCTGFAEYKGHTFYALLCNKESQSKVIWAGNVDIPEAAVRAMDAAENYGWDPLLCKPLFIIRSDGTTHE